MNGAITRPLFVIFVHIDRNVPLYGSEVRAGIIEMVPFLTRASRLAPPRSITFESKLSTIERERMFDGLKNPDTRSPLEYAKPYLLCERKGQNGTTDREAGYN